MASYRILATTTPRTVSGDIDIACFIDAGDVKKFLPDTFDCLNLNATTFAWKAQNITDTGTHQASDWMGVELKHRAFEKPILIALIRQSQIPQMLENQITKYHSTEIIYVRESQLESINHRGNGKLENIDIKTDMYTHTLNFTTSNLNNSGLKSSQLHSKKPKPPCWIQLWRWLYSWVASFFSH